MALTLSSACLTAISKLAGGWPSCVRAPCPETYRKSPAMMPGLYGPMGLGPLAATMTRFWAPKLTATANNSHASLISPRDLLAYRSFAQCQHYKNLYKTPLAFQILSG